MDSPEPTTDSRGSPGSTQAAPKNLRKLKVGPFSCYYSFKPGQPGREHFLGEEDNFDGENREGLEGYEPQGQIETALFNKKGPLGPGPIPALTPLGGGGWHLEEDLTPEMRDVTDKALQLFHEKRKKELTDFNRGFLTPLTLINYVDPCSPEHLNHTLLRRAERERDLKCENGPGMYLNGSCRIVGFDGRGRSIVASEPCTMKRSVGSYLDQIEYVTWTALDLSRPAGEYDSNGFIELVDFGGGFNFMHFLDPRPCIQIAEMMESQFRRRAKVVIFVEMPPSFETILNTFLQVVKPGTRAKLRYVANPAEAIESFQQMGCSEDTCSRIAGFMAERRNKQVLQTWHPVVDHPFFREKMTNLRLDQNTLYFDGTAHKRLREVIQEFRIATWGAPMRPLPLGSIAQGSTGAPGVTRGGKYSGHEGSGSPSPAQGSGGLGFSSPVGSTGSSPGTSPSPQKVAVCVAGGASGSRAMGATSATSPVGTAGQSPSTPIAPSTLSGQPLVAPAPATGAIRLPAAGLVGGKQALAPPTIATGGLTPCGSPAISPPNTLPRSISACGSVETSQPQADQRDSSSTGRRSQQFDKIASTVSAPSGGCGAGLTRAFQRMGQICSGAGKNTNSQKVA